MNVTESIINTALLGTAAKEFVPAGLPEALQESFREFREKAEDTEATFFRMSALTFAYHRAGLEPLPAEAATAIDEAPEDEKSYFDRQAGELLTQLHANRNRYLLLHAYRKASRCDKLIPPLYLPALLEHAFDRNNPDKHEEQALLARITGNRGRWLLQHMELPDWGDTGTESWETASHEERKRMLRSLRKENPEQGLALLQTELKNDSAAHREELIQCLRINLGKNDEPFLQEIAATDRSSNVKETARRLLCSLPDSLLVSTYCDLLRGKLHYNLLLGWSYDKISFTPEMKKLGLEEISSNKQEKDEHFLLRQLAERVPLAFWAEFYHCSPEKAAGKLAKKPPFSPHFALCHPIENFGDSLWAYYTLKENPDEANVSSLMGLLPPEQREKIHFQTESKNTYIPDSWFNADGTTWGIKFSSRVMQRILRSNYYYYPKETAERLALYFPPEMEQKLEQQAASLEADNPIAKFCRLTAEYLRIKERIHKLFNDNK